VGDSGTILHCDIIGEWSSMESGTANNLNSIWGTATDNIYAVGDSGTILKYNVTWSTISSTGDNLNGIWGSAYNDIYVVGDNGTILHYDGNNWSAITPKPTLNNLNSIWVGSSTNILAAGDSGTILYSDGTDWHEIEIYTTNDLRCIFSVLNPSTIVVGVEYIGGADYPKLYGTIFDSCTREPLTGIKVTWDDVDDERITDQDGNYSKFSLQYGDHPLKFEDIPPDDGYSTENTSITLPYEEIDLKLTTYLLPTDYESYSGCISGVVSEDIVIGQDTTVEHGITDQHIEVELIKNSVVVGITYTNNYGHFLFPNVPDSGEYPYTVRIVNPASYVCDVETYSGIAIPQDEATRYDFKLVCEDVVNCQADLNNSGSVMADDGNILSFYWMQGVYPNDPCDPGNETNCCVADMNNSGSVMADDGNILSFYWMQGVYPNTPCPDRTPPCTF